MKKLLLSALLGAFLVSSASEAKDKLEVEKITLTKDNVLILDSPFTSKSVALLTEEAKKKDAELASGYPMYLFLYTPGGSIQAGLELIEFLNALNRPVHTVTWFAASMGFQTVQHLGDRYILRYGTLMSHKASGYFGGEFGGDASQIDSRYGFWLRRIKLMDEKTVERTKGKQTMKSYISSYSPELWLNGEEAVQQGYADKLATVICGETLKGTRKIRYDLGFIVINILVSECPLQTGVLAVEAELVTNKGSMALDEFLNKNGQFNCQKVVQTKKAKKQKRSSYKSFSFSPIYDDEDGEPQYEKEEDQLCSRSELTLEQIRAKMLEIKQEHMKDLKDKVQRSY